MNPIDLVVVVILLASAVMGWRAGFVKEVLGLVGLFLGLFLANLLYKEVAQMIEPHLQTGQSVAPIVAFVLIWVGTPLVLWLLGHLLTRVLRLTGLGLLNSLLGCVVGVLKYAVLMGVVLNVCTLTHLVPPQIEQESRIAAPIRRVTSVAFDAAKKQWHEQHPQDTTR